MGALSTLCEVTTRALLSEQVSCFQDNRLFLIPFITLIQCLFLFSTWDKLIFFLLKWYFDVHKTIYYFGNEHQYPITINLIKGYFLGSTKFMFTYDFD